MKHEGLHANRLKREHNALEKAFADKWKQENAGANPLLNQLLATNDTFLSAASQRDATVAATIIQWLGSEVGSGFIDEVRKSQK